MGTKEALVGMSDEAWAAAAEKRCKGLVHLLGIGEEEAGDTSIRGRLSIIAKLKAAKRAEIGRGQTGSWLYDVNRHLSICACLRREYEALEERIRILRERRGEAGAEEAAGEAGEILDQ